MTTLILLLATSPEPHITVPVGQALEIRLPCPEGGDCRWELYGLDWSVLDRHHLPRVEGCGPDRTQIYEFRARREATTSFLALHAKGGSSPIAKVRIHVEVTK